MKLRGAQVAPGANLESLQDLFTLGVNIIRFQVQLVDASNWREYLITQIMYFEQQVVPFAQEHKVKVILQLMVTNPDRSLVTDFWVRQSKKKYPKNVIFGLVNEPPYTDTTRYQKVLIKKIRKRDPVRKILFTTRNSNPTFFKALDEPVADPNIIYEAHLYHQLWFTHQGALPYPDLGIQYPSERLNKEDIVKFVEPIRRFQAKNRAKILISEFGCSTFVDEESRLRWFKDCISIFDGYYWDWCLHSWREAVIWNIENSPKILRLFKKEWAKN